MAKFTTTFYNLVLKRTSTFSLAVLASVFMFERGFDVLADKIFDEVNKGKLWKHIKDKYE
ncbi:PREDICTED: cytochrome b-c1 complex subunit 9 [Dinoponera quadriceps]|uniref:Complex III subunit 9 n=1 Tax=Dinoponera quadriceps TaxID=609295 RepID=A0A6P3XRH7_DINQU|nr:PREDICTED: cytochrome b-c1 complex subunit 9 [Dinoponera quadriceps]